MLVVTAISCMPAEFSQRWRRWRGGSHDEPQRVGIVHGHARVGGRFEAQPVRWREVA